MTLKDFFEQDWGEPLWVCDNLYDYYYGKYFGLKLTEEGKNKFACLLEVGCIVDTDNERVVVDINSHKENGELLSNQLFELFCLNPSKWFMYE